MLLFQAVFLLPLQAVLSPPLLQWSTALDLKSLVWYLPGSGPFSDVSTGGCSWFHSGAVSRRVAELGCCGLRFHVPVPLSPEIIDDLTSLVENTDERLRSQTRHVRTVEKKSASCGREGLQHKSLHSRAALGRPGRAKE